MGAAGSPPSRDGPRAFGLLLQRHRLTAGLSQEELAERAGLSRRGISDLERGLRQAPYATTLRRLADALGLLEPDRAILLAAARGLGAPPPGEPVLEPPPSSPAAGYPKAPGQLPRELTSFVGREQDLLELGRLVRASPLVTLTGPGGVGKTRLALRVAEAVLAHQADGVCVIELAALTEPQLVPHAAAEALGIVEQPGRTLARSVVDACHSRDLLVVLDNCEHLADASAELAWLLLRGCPKLHILATSREPLRVPGETVWRVPPLRLPASAASAEQIRQTEAVQLFLDRARAASPGFAVTDANAPPVAAVCRGLDGIPLALELAAARVPGLGVETLARQLGDRLRLLGVGSRTAAPRHQTLRATLAWSHDLLTPDERVLFRRVAVFAGGWTVQAAEVVCAGDGLAREAVQDGLAALVDRSLLNRLELGGESRFGMLETIREYASERLTAGGEAHTIHARHAAHFLELAERAEIELLGPRQQLWLKRLDAEHDNLRAAFEWGQAAGEAALGLRLAASLWRFWWYRCHFSEGLARLADALAARPDLPAAVRARALTGAGILARDHGDHEQAMAYLQASLAASREHGDRQGVGAALKALGNAAWSHGDFAEARSFFDQSLIVQRELGDLRGIAAVLTNLGGVAVYEGDFARAEALCDEGLRLLRRLGDTQSAATCLDNLADAARGRGDLARAAALYRESLLAYREVDDAGQGIAECLEGLAAVAGAEGHFERAARLLGSADMLREAVSAPLPPADRAQHVTCIATARAHLGEQAFVQAWATGRAASREEAFRDALGAGHTLRSEGSEKVLPTGQEPGASRAAHAPRNARAAPRHRGRW